MSESGSEGLDPARRQALDSVRLSRLVVGHAPDAPRELTAFAGGVALVGEHDLWVLPVDATRFGAVLAWVAGVDPDARRELDVVADDAALVARRAMGLHPVVRVWSVEGTDLAPAVPAPAPPDVDPPEAPELVDVLSAAGLDVVVEHGVVTGEVKGLEVARVVPGGERPHLAIGVGVYDQGAFSAMNADRALDGTEDPDRLVADLVDVRDRILAHRGRGGDPHLANRLVRPRWLRATALAEPAAVGLTEMEAVPLVEPRPGLNEHAPAAAVGRDDAGRRVLAVFSVGVDLEIVAVAADLSLVHDPERILLVLPPRDHHPAVVRASTRLAVPAGIVGLEGEWAAVA